MKFRLRAAAALAALAAVALVLAGASIRGALAVEVRLTLLNGDSRKVDLHSIGEDGQLQLADGTVRLNQLREIRKLEETAMNAPAAIVVELVGQARLPAESVTVADDHCSIRGHGLNSQPLALPLDMVAGVQFRSDRFEKQIRSAFQSARKEDQLLLEVEGSLETLSGLVESMDEKGVAFTWDNESRTFPRENLIAIAIASIGSATERDRNCLVHFRDGGSKIWAKILGLSGNELRLEIAKEQTLVTDWRRVASIGVRSDSLRFVSDLTPVASEHRPIVAIHRPPQMDRNASGGALTLRNQVFEKGIGVATNSRLAYRLNKEYSRLCAIVGIDQETSGHGNCVFVVRGDGQELVRVAKRGTDEPERIQIQIKGIEVLELIVEAGVDLDLADHANWCDLCVLRE